MARILLRDLVPGQRYEAQVRVSNKTDYSPWSRLFTIATIKETIKPGPPDNLTFTFEGTAAVAKWDAPTEDEFGNPLLDLKDYEVTVMTQGNVDPIATTKYITASTRFEFTQEMNSAIYGGIPKGALTVEVRARDTTGNLSAPATATALNDPPTAPTNIIATPITDGVVLDWDDNPDDDFSHFEVYVATQAGFVPTPANREYRGPISEYQHTVVSGHVKLYFIVKAFDTFGLSSAGPEVNATPLKPYTVDVVAPNMPATATVAAEASASRLGNDSALILTFPAVTDPGDLAGYAVRYSPYDAAAPAVRTWDYVDVPSDDHTGTFRIGNLRPNTPYYVEVNAYDIYSNRSGWKAATLTTSPPGEFNAPMVLKTTMQSSDYNGTLGWRLSSTGFDLQQGTINARALQIQEGQNIMPPQFAGFEFHSNYYVSANLERSAGNVQIVGSPKFESQAFQFDANGYVYMNSNSTAANGNIPVDPNTRYIFSYWARSVSGSPQIGAVVRRGSSGDAFEAVHGLTTTYTRYWFAFDTGASDTVASVFFNGSAGGVIQIDGLQMERKIGALDTPSQWKPPGVTRIDGAIIRTGEIRSTAMGPYDSRPAWSLGLTGNMEVNDAVVRGKLVVGAPSASNSSIFVASHNYGAAGSQWAIRGDGSFDIKSGTGSRVQLSNTGLVASNGSIDTVSINTDGTFTFRTGTSGVALTNTGLVVTRSDGFVVANFDTAGNATFKGNITGATGTFNGTLSAGLVTGSTISGNTIKSSATPGTAYSFQLDDTYGLRIWDYQATQRFQVDMNGYVTASHGTFTGHVNATSGLFQGEVTASVVQTQNFGARVRMINTKNDSIQWVDSNGDQTGELRGTIDSGARGVYINSDCQIGHIQSVIHQVGKRAANGQAWSGDRVRASKRQVYVTAPNAYLQNFYCPFEVPMDQAPTFVVASPAGGGNDGLSMITQIQVSGIEYHGFYGTVFYQNGTLPGSGLDFFLSYYAELVL